MAETRRLRGHTATATCCVASRSHPGIIVTAGEDGRLCWFDMRCKDLVLALDVGKVPITSLCFKPDNEDTIFTSFGTEVKCFDVHLTSSSKLLKSYSYNKEEINQVVCNSNPSFLASADDSGEIKIIDIHQDGLYKTLRSGHSSICSSVQFIPWRRCTVITGGLDSKVIMWDFSKGKSCIIEDYGNPEMSNGRDAQPAQKCFNPAFVHALVVPDCDMLGTLGRICAVARGDGVVDLISSDIEVSSTWSRQSLKPEKKSRSISNECGTSNNTDLNGKRKPRFSLDYSLGGHTAAVSCLAFGKEGKLLISGGNDRRVKVWNASRCLNLGEVDNCNHLALDINVTRKVNWLCTTPATSNNLVVCDTTKTVKVYTVS